MHPSVPLVKVLEKVPREHGSNVATPSLLSSILLNPEAKRAEVRNLPLAREGQGTPIASVWEITGFLGDAITLSLIVYFSYFNGKIT